MFNRIGFSFENWTPIWEQNTEDNNWHGRRYQNYSIALMRRAHPDWSTQRITAEAQAAFETAGIELFVAALEHARKMRPNTLWGFCKRP